MDSNIPLHKLSLARSLTRIYGEALVSGGEDSAMTKFNELKDDTTHYYIDEREMNTLGYDLLYKANFSGHNELSREVFKINTPLIPQRQLLRELCRSIDEGREEGGGISHVQKISYAGSQ